MQFEEETESATAQNVADIKRHISFPDYDDEDILDWDVAITTPPPRPSGTIRVKLKYKGEESSARRKNRQGHTQTRKAHIKAD